MPCLHGNLMSFHIVPIIAFEVGFAGDFTDHLILKDGDFSQYCIGHHRFLRHF